MLTIIDLGNEHCGWEPGMQWARRHGIDPGRVHIPNRITVDDEQRTVTVERYRVLAQRGEFVANMATNELVCASVTIQLESAALPWPE